MTLQWSPQAIDDDLILLRHHISTEDPPSVLRTVGATYQQAHKLGVSGRERRGAVAPPIPG